MPKTIHDRRYQQQNSVIMNTISRAPTQMKASNVSKRLLNVGCWLIFWTFYFLFSHLLIGNYHFRRMSIVQDSHCRLAPRVFFCFFTGIEVAKVCTRSHVQMILIAIADGGQVSDQTVSLNRSEKIWDHCIYRNCRDTGNLVSDCGQPLPQWNCPPCWYIAESKMQGSKLQLCCYLNELK